MKKKGFTLIEMIAVMALIGILSTLIFTLFNKTHKVFSETEKESVNVDNARTVLSIIGEDIRMASKVEISPNDKINGNAINLLKVTKDMDEFIYTQEESEKYTEIRKYKIGENKPIATLARFSPSGIVEVGIADVSGTDSYKISIRDKSDKDKIIYETIATSRLINIQKEE